MFIYIFSLLITLATPFDLSDPKTLIIDRFVWIRYDQDNNEKYLTLISDGSVILSHSGKFKINEQDKPSATIRRVIQKFIITLDDFIICSNGYNNRPVICDNVWKKKNIWEFIDTKYGTMIENDGMCITKGRPIYINGEPTGEIELHMLPCNYTVNQMFTIILTEDRNWQIPEK